MRAILINQRLLLVVNSRSLLFMVSRILQTEQFGSRNCGEKSHLAKPLFYLAKTIRRSQMLSDYNLFHPIINIDKVRVFYFHYIKYVKQIETNK